MTTTAGDQINGALRLIGQLAEGETPSAATSRVSLSWSQCPSDSPSEATGCGKLSPISSGLGLLSASRELAAAFPSIGVFMGFSLRELLRMPTVK